MTVSHQPTPANAGAGSTVESLIATRPSPGSLGALAALGVAAALWSLFLWGELLVSRAGGSAFCAFGEGAACTALWDAPFASAVHRATGLPVAAWGLVWGLVALALPLAALVWRAEGREEPAFVSAIRITAAVAGLGVLVLIAVVVAVRSFCIGCFVTYVIVTGYVLIALFAWRPFGLPEATRGAMLAAGAALGAFGLLLYPGLQTPRQANAAGREAIETATLAPTGGAAANGTGDAQRDRQLAELVASLEPELKQTLSDSLYLYRRSPALSPPLPRALQGSQQAPVRITEFTDALCDHCAELHQTLRALRERLPAESFSVDSRQFPLDGRCNPMLQPRQEESVRCLAAQARVCVEGPHALEFAGALFESQASLTPGKVFELAGPYMKRPQLESCVSSPATRARIEEDVRAAAPYEPDGTPIVLVNGRLGTSFGPFLYAMVLTRGADAHPAFEALPPPNPRAHLH
jgi:serine/threonine-protein kinase